MWSSGPGAAARHVLFVVRMLHGAEQAAMGGLLAATALGTVLLVHHMKMDAIAHQLQC